MVVLYQMLLCTQVKGQLAVSINQRASSALDEAQRWITDARSKVAWCAETEGDIDHDGIKFHMSAINDLCNSMSEGEMMRDTAVHRAQNAMLAAAESDDSHWNDCCRQLNDDWMKLAAELQQTR